MKQVYIHSVGAISAQKTFETDSFLEEVVEYYANVFPAVDPDYKTYIISPSGSGFRRMAKGVKMGISASKLALKEAGRKEVDAIITGSGMGCMIDTERFLSAIIQNEEQYLTPTPFIQSTHNTVGGQIALELNCKGYNLTYTNASNSFESALLDAHLQLSLAEADNILVGGVDELSDHNIMLHKLINYVKEQPVASSQLLKSNTKGAVFSEGANFFVLGHQKQESSYAQLRAVKLYNTLTPGSLKATVQEFLNDNGYTCKDIDVVVFGYNGDIEYDHYYHTLANDSFNNTAQVYYKHLCGEFYTASSFAFWLGCQVLKHQEIPKVLRINTISATRPSTLLLYNQYRGENHSFTLLTSC